MGAQDDFDFAIDFIGDTGIGGAEDLTMLWDPTGTSWRIVGATVNSSMQLYSHDLTNKSGLIFFNDAGRDSVLDAAPMEPWAPAGASTSP